MRFAIEQSSTRGDPCALVKAVQMAHATICSMSAEVRVDMIGWICNLGISIWDSDILIGRSKEIGVRCLKLAPASFGGVDVDCYCNAKAFFVNWWGSKAPEGTGSLSRRLTGCTSLRKRLMSCLTMVWSMNQSVGHILADFVRMGPGWLSWKSMRISSLETQKCPNNLPTGPIRLSKPNKASHATRRSLGNPMANCRPNQHDQQPAPLPHNY